MIISKAQVEAAQLVMGLDGQELCAANISEAYRNLARKHHPDVGGDASQFVALDRAKCLLLHWISQAPATRPVSYRKPDCPNCKGLGRILIRRHFGGVLPIMCGRCKGSGDAQWEADNSDT